MSGAETHGEGSRHMLVMWINLATMTCEYSNEERNIEREIILWAQTALDACTILINVNVKV